MPAGSIVFDLLMRTGSFVTDTARAERSLRQMERAAKSAGRGIRDSFAGNLLANFATEAVRSIAQFTREIVSGQDALKDVAEAAGSTVNNVSALENAYRLSGGALEDVSADLVKFNKLLTEAKPGSQAEATLKSIGLSAAELRKQDPAEAFRQVAVAIDGYAESGKKARIVQDLFDKRAESLAPRLADIAEQTSLVGTATQEGAEQAEEFAKNIGRLQTDIVGLGRSIANDVLPFLNDMVTALREAKREGQESLLDGILGTSPLAKAQGAVKLIEADVARVATTIERFEEALTRPGANEDFLKTRIDKARARLKSLQDDLTAANQRVKDLADIASPIALAGPGGAKKDAPDVPDKPPTTRRATEAERYLEALRGQIEATLELTTREKALLDIQEGRLDGITPRLKEQILAQAELVDLNRQAFAARDAEIETNGRIARTQLESLAALQEGNKALREEIELIGLDEIGVIGVEKARVSSTRALKEETLAKKEAEGVAETQLQVLQAEIAALREREELLGRKISRSLEERTLEGSRNAAKEAGDAFAEQIEDGILRGSRAGLDVIDIFIQELKAQFGKTILRPLIQPVAAGGNELIGQIIGAASAYFSGGYNPVGDSFSQTGEMIRGRRARGGDVHPGGDYWVGEEGPERFRPSTSGRIIPAGQSASGNMKVIVNTPPGVVVSRQQQTDASTLEMWLEMAEDRIAGSIANGTGKTARAMKSRGVNLNRSLPRRD